MADETDEKTRLEQFTIFVRAPANLLNKDGDPEKSVYYKLEAKKEAWGEPLEAKRTASLEQLALQGTMLANMPPEHVIGGACFFLNAQLIIDGT